MPDRRDRTRPVRLEKNGAWKPRFLQALGEHGMVTMACHEAGIGRQTAYDARHSDEAFAIAWADVEEATTERMEGEAIRRAVDGVVREVFYQGEVVGQELHYSDNLLMFMLKARRPDKYRDNVRVESDVRVRVDHGVVTSEDLAGEARALLRRVAATSRD